MPLSAAMALSGLNEDQFGKELKHLYGYGARLLKPLNSALSNAYNLSSSQNLSMEQRSNSMESGIASLPSSRSSTDTYWDFLRQLDRVKLEKVKPQKPRVATTASAWPPPDHSLSTPPLRSVSTPTPEPVIAYGNRDLLDLGSHIRNSNSWKFQPAVLPDFEIVPRRFLTENRSQYSRISNDFLAPTTIETCTDPDCRFETPYYKM